MIFSQPHFSAMGMKQLSEPYIQRVEWQFHGHVWVFASGFFESVFRHDLSVQSVLSERKPFDVAKK